MNTKLHAAILIAATVLVPAFALSGERVTNREVKIGPTPHLPGRTRAEGSLMAARNSDDTVQYIGCRAHQEIGYCYARNEAGTPFMCSSSDPQMIVAMAAVNMTSHIIVDAQTGICKNLEVTNMSRYIAPIGNAIGNPLPGSL